MDIAIRVPLYYVFDFVFNQMTAPVRPNITLFGEEDSIWKNDQSPSFLANEANSIQKAAENVTSIFQVMYDVDYTSNLTFWKIVFMFFTLMLMLFLTTRHALKGFCFTIATLYFVYSVSSTKDFQVLQLDTTGIFIIRCFFFITINAFSYYQMNPTNRPTAIATLALFFHCILSTLNFQGIQFYLVKYVSISLIIFFCVYQQTSLQDFFSKNANRIRAIIIASAFYFLHCTPLVEWSKYGYEYVSHPSAAEWSAAGLEAVNLDVSSLARVIVMTLLLTVFSFTVNSEVEERAQSDHNPGFQIIGSTPHHWEHFLISPACFFIFIVDKTVWHFECQNRWSILQIFIAMYFATIVFNFCETINCSKRSLLETRQSLGKVVLFTMFCTVVMFAYCFWKLSDGMETRTLEMGIVVCLCSYSLLISTMYYCAFILLLDKSAADKARLVYTLNCAEFCIKSLSLTFIVVSLLLVCFYQTFDLFVFLGAIYFASKLVKGFVGDFCEFSKGADDSKNKSLSRISYTTF